MLGIVCSQFSKIEGAWLYITNLSQNFWKDSQECINDLLVRKKLSAEELMLLNCGVGEDS